MNKPGLKNLNVGESYTGYCILRKKELKYKQNGDPYLVLELGDHSGRLRAKAWKGAKEHYDNLGIGKLMKVQGKIQSFLDASELNIERMRLARKDEEIELENIVPVSKKDIAELKMRFARHLEGISDENIRALLDALFQDPESLEEFLKAPSGKLWHHNYLYGVLEHVVCMLDLADVLYLHYPQLKIDLLKAGIIIQKAGRKIQLGYEDFIDFTTEGRLLGPNVLAFQIVNEAIQKVEDFPEELRLQLLHMVLSQPENINQGSPVIPMTLESIILYLLDELDMSINATQRIIENDRLPDSNWTRFNNLFNRFIYVGDQAINQKSDEQDE